MKSRDDWDYPKQTRLHYQSASTAQDYKARLSFVRSPIDWAIGRLEVQTIKRALRDVQDRGSVLDIPAGTGKLTQLLTDEFGLYVAGDISREMLELIPGDVARKAMDITNLPFQEAAFDVGVCLRLLHRVPLQVASTALNELSRVVRKAIIVSYASEPRMDRAIGAVRSILGREDNRVLQFSPPEFADFSRRHGWLVAGDWPVGPLLSSERIAVLTSSDSGAC